MISIDRITRIKSDVKRATRSLFEWVGLFFFVSIGVDFVLWLNQFEVYKSNSILKIIIAVALWIHINKEEK
ncbi:TPA: hypothetical protein I9089_002333 [Clostridium perfringens]|uniref:hypothetical protein n=1 Tax=Clostridium perfringens TaxID=1502 RepID=UPI000707D5C5|nr:hypothetical protein [Clostridium perfringens]KQC91336.1 hypothetical protein AM596_14965 [Clostridium perfringens CP4]HAT4302228.1 hypothetical protein [Clostridium perfringens]